MLTEAMRRRLTAMRQRHLEESFRRQVENRPEVRTSGRPVATAEVRAGQLEARRRLRERVDAQGGKSPCPAATSTRGAAGETVVRCGVERYVLSSRTDPQSLVTFCFGDHEACTSWRADKERLWAGKRPLVSAAEGV